MKISPLPFRSPLAAYEAQARELLDAFRARDRDAVNAFWQNHPRFLRDDPPWAMKDMPREDVERTPLDDFDARLALARWYTFQDWRWMRRWVLDVADEHSPAGRFESAVEAVVNGNVATLRALLSGHPDLIRARSTRVNGFDPPIHRATLLHYIAANGVENHRQQTPPNAVEVAKILLDAGADVDALADMYGGQCTTMSMLVSSCHPHKAGVQAALAETLLEYGAALDGVKTGKWNNPLMTALIFGYPDTAEMLARRGARVDTAAAAAGLGRADEVRRLLPQSSPEDRHRALGLAALLGRADVVRLLLDAGEDPNRFNPDGFHAHGTPLHHASCNGHLDVVKLLVERGARLDIKDTLWDGTPLGWAEYCGRPDVASYLRSVTGPGASPPS